MEIDVEGDKSFVIEKFNEMLVMMKKAPVVVAGKRRGRKPKVQAPPVVAEEAAAPVVEKPKAKRGRKPKAQKAPKVPAKRGRKPKAQKAPKAKPEKAARKVRTDQKDKDLAELIQMKGARKDNDRIVLAGYFINKNQKKREFRSNDIVAVMKKAGLPEPKNTTYHLRKLTDDKGLLMHGRKQGRYKVSDAGVKWVEYN